DEAENEQEENWDDHRELDGRPAPSLSHAGATTAAGQTGHCENLQREAHENGEFPSPLESSRATTTASGLPRILGCRRDAALGRGFARFVAECCEGVIPAPQRKIPASYRRCVRVILLIALVGAVLSVATEL